MYTIPKSWPSHPNAYQWPEDNASNNRTIAELRSQIDQLRGRVALLSQMLQSSSHNYAQQGRQL